MSSLLDLPLETYRAILEDLPAAVYLVDRERRIVFWNDGCERITGYRRHEVMGKCCADDLLMHCDAKNNVLCGTACPLLATMNDGRPREADVFLLHKGGHRVPVRVRAIPVRSDDAAIVGACECFDERTVLLPATCGIRLAEPSSSLDEVTLLPGRNAVLRRLQADLREFQVSHIPFGVLCLTIDNLDRLRVTAGGQAVHSVLHAAAQTLAKGVGPGDLVGCWSEGLFVAILSPCTETTLLESAVALKRVAGLDAVPWWGDRLTITLSAGGTIARAQDTPEEVVRRAKEALKGSVTVGLDRVAVV